MMAQTAFEVNIDFQGIRAILSRVVTPMVVRRYSSSFKTMLLICEHNEIQWGSEYQPFEYRKHLNMEIFDVRISYGAEFKWSVYVLCPMYFFYYKLKRITMDIKLDFGKRKSALKLLKCLKKI